jgi:hypothetical protein
MAEMWQLSALNGRMAAIMAMASMAYGVMASINHRWRQLLANTVSTENNVKESRIINQWRRSGK